MVFESLNVFLVPVTKHREKTVVLIEIVVNQLVCLSLIRTGFCYLFAAATVKTAA
jgi:hypothetical protein